MFRRCGSLALAVAVFCSCCALGKEMTDIEVLTAVPTRCTYEHAYDMYGAHCAGLRLDKIPSLRGGIEILDFSDNKLQEIGEHTLSSYTSLKYLYLSDNTIFNIHENAFDYLTGLISLDLSKNVIMSVPSKLLQLPSLRKLYLGGNPLLGQMSSLDKLAENKDIAAPLELLDISNCKLDHLPEWGLLPQLLLYNVSNNPLRKLEAKHFAVMCNLGKVDLTKSIDVMPLCRLRPAISWFQDKRIFLQLDADGYSQLNSRDFEKCPQFSDVEAGYNETYHVCKKEYLQMESSRTTRRTWLTISGGLVGFLVIFMLVLYLMHRANVARTKTAAEKMKASKPRPDGDKKASVVLLDDVS
ncbi:leucine rich repeat domain-containing protein [Phthorimaea operculella]|nr:leucine rich repeat domain-containing protein [Phthorimaea operculella]